MTDKSERYSVWVGGGEVNDYMLTKEAAESLAAEWTLDGYDAVIRDEVAYEATA